MAVTFIASTGPNSGTSSGTGVAGVPANPAGVVAGDVILGMFMKKAGSGVALPTGWTSIASGVLGTVAGWNLGWHLQETTVGSSWTITATTAYLTATAAFHGVDTINPVDAQTTANAVTTATSSITTSTTVSTTAAGGMALFMVFSNGAVTYTTEASSGVTWTEQFDGGTSGGLMLSWGAKATAGSLGIATATASATTQYVAIEVALKASTAVATPFRTLMGVGA